MRSWTSNAPLLSPAVLETLHHEDTMKQEWANYDKHLNLLLVQHKTDIDRRTTTDVNPIIKSPGRPRVGEKLQVFRILNINASCLILYLSFTMEDIPNELLIAILKLAADSPSRSATPTPICASSVNRRWRAIALSTTELWTTIRISHRPHSLRWAVIFAPRSGSHPLDISVDLAQDGHSVDALTRVLALLTPHLGRWRTFGFRAAVPSMRQFRHFLSNAPHDAIARLESLHLYCTDQIHYNLDDVQTLQLVGLNNLRTLKTNVMWDLSIASQATMLQVLDIDIKHSQVGRLWDRIEQLLSATPSLDTLVLRNFCPKIEYQPHSRTAAPGLRSLALSFAQPLYSWDEGPTGFRCGGFETLTSLFSLPNLERLELIGGFEGGAEETRYLAEQARYLAGELAPEPGRLSMLDLGLLAQWDAQSWVPRLRELRLDNVRFTPDNLAFIQSFTRGITQLELIYTWANEYLLNADLQWPAVRELTVEAFEEGVTPWWLPTLVELRRAYVPLEEVVVTLLPPQQHRLVVNPTPAIRYLCDGPSRSLLDGAFYWSEESGLVEDFEPVDDEDQGELGEEGVARPERGSRRQRVERVGGEDLSLV
ncbi:hypothetical protein FB45DRAFT_1080507 [Roridomyces roridus]|uniref:F-box domain-containing protein n=1 Tax=Roridomyces roridus TaxID=1738132 RepID=A0AAD7BSJ9_9AGAR|nr:hypothetical protein FB45DRAFT_1080507 [Roridomyces roridus]